jgi:4-amino-4-deoxy-L-arabinose transferase-like glycosyltransferase
LALVFGALYGLLLGRAPLANPDEGRYAEIPREMVASGDWVTPRLDGVAYFEKPPLCYWAAACCIEILGPGEASLRAAPVLFGVGGVLLTYAAGRRLGGRACGLAAASVLGSSALYFAMSRLLTLDMAVSVLMSAGLFCFILGVREGPGGARRRLFYGLYVAAALATLAKGLIGFALTGAVMFTWLLVFNQWRRLRPLYLPSGAALFLAVAAPWHVLMARRHPAWADFYFIHEHWARFTTTEHHRFHPWWYFIPFLLLGLFPWTCFLWPSLRRAIAGGWARRRENADAWFPVVWAAVVFIFFSASHSKLVPYILPVFPPLAVIVGGWLADRWADNSFAPLGRGLLLYYVASVLLAACLCAVVLKPGLAHGMDPEQAVALRPFVIAAAAVLAAGAAAAVWLGLARGVRGALAAVAGAAILFFEVAAAAAPDIQPPGTKDLALRLRELVRPGDRVYAYHEFFDDFAYYAGRSVGIVGFQGELEPFNDDPARIRGTFAGEAAFRAQWSGPGRVFAVARKSDAAELFADRTFQYHLLAESRRHYLFSNRP